MSREFVGGIIFWNWFSFNEWPFIIKKKEENYMNKRQAIQPSIGVPQSLLSHKKTPTDVHDDLIRIIPSQTSPLAMTTGQQKLTVDFPIPKPFV